MGGYTFTSDTNQIFNLMLILTADDLITLLGQTICVYVRTRARDFKITLF